MGIGIVDYVRLCSDISGSIWYHPEYYVRYVDVGVPILYKTFYAKNRDGRRYAQGLVEIRKCISRPLLPIEARENRIVVFS